MNGVGGTDVQLPVRSDWHSSNSAQPSEKQPAIDGGVAKGAHLHAAPYPRAKRSK